MQSYLLSGTAGRPSNSVWSGDLRLHALAHGVRDRLRRARLVVVADERAPAVGHEPVVCLGAHLEREPQRRALELARPDVGADHVAEEGGCFVGDVALGEDEAELPALCRRVVGRELDHVVDPGGLEEAQELDVVHVLHRVEVAEAHALEGREGVVGPHRRGRSGIWMRAITLTLNQNSAPAGITIARTMSADLRFSARSRKRERITSRRPSSASSPSTAQYFLFRSPQAIASIRAVNATMPLTAGRSPPIFWPAMKAIRLAAAAAKVTRAPIVSTSGRSPSSIGSSCSRTAAFLSSERET